MRRWYLSSALFAASLFALWLPTQHPDATALASGPIPTRPLNTRVDPNQSVTLIVLDTSGSMKEEGDTVASYLRTQGTGLVGLITYSDSARMLIQPSQSIAAREAALGALNWRGGSNMYAGLDTALNWFRQHSTGGRILLVSDGSINVGQVDPMIVAALGREASSLGVVIDVLQISVPLSPVLDVLASKSRGEVRVWSDSGSSL